MRQSIRLSRTNTRRLDKIRLETTTLARVGVTSLLEKIVETSLRYFGNVERRHVNYIVRKVDQMKSS